STSSTAQSNALNKLSQSYARGNTQISKEMTLMNKIVDASMKAMHRHINNNIPGILGSLRALAGSMPRAFGGLQHDMSYIGLSAMNGLTAGLIRGSSGPINQARYVANQIRAVMQSALRINSPSHVMRDDVGRWIPAGVAEGIKKHSRLIDSDIDGMYNMIVPQSPELAIGANMSNNVRGAMPSTKSYTNNKNIVVNLDYNGSGTKEDADDLVDIIDRELESRASLHSYLMGGR